MGPTVPGKRWRGRGRVAVPRDGRREKSETIERNTCVCVCVCVHDGAVRGVGGDWPTKPYGQNYHTHTPAPAPI